MISEAQWRHVIDSAIDTGFITVDEAGRVTSWNQGASRILGWTEPEMIGWTLDRLFTAEAQRTGHLAAEMRAAIEFGRGGGEEGWRVRKDGSMLWAAGEMTPIRSETGAVIGFVKVLRDRTRQRQIEEQLAEERRALTILNRAGSALAIETELPHLVQIVTDAGVDLTGAEFGAFFYNVVNDVGESYMLYTLSGAPLDAFSKFPMPRNTKVFAPTFEGHGIVRSKTSRRIRATGTTRRTRACRRVTCPCAAISRFP